MWTINQDHMMYGSWDIKFFVILGYFLTFDPPNNPEIQNFEKIKKIIILHISSINENHDVCMIPEIWSVTDRIFSHFGPFFALLHSSPLQQPLTAWNMKKSKKWKNCLEIWDIIILHKCTKNHDHMLYCSWDMARDTYFFFHSGLFFAVLLP